MDQRVIDTIDCAVCLSPKGVPCTRNDEGGCGMRIDDFLREGSYEDRLALHLDTMKRLAGAYPMLHEHGSIFLSDTEYLQLLIDADKEST